MFTRSTVVGAFREVRGRRRLVVAAAMVVTLVLVAWTTDVGAQSSGPTRAVARPTTTAGAKPGSKPASKPHSAMGVQPGSDPSALPGPLLIADRGNNRLLEIDPRGKILWEFPRRGDLRPGETFKVPDDAFFTPDGKQIIATQEDDFVVTLIDVVSRKIVWRYGTPGVHGSGDNQLWNPDDALVLPDGSVLISDIKHCRVLVVRKGEHKPARVFGKTTSLCKHLPPQRFGSPNGAFPLSDGSYLVTEINQDFVTKMDLAGNVAWSMHPPVIRYPSDTNEISPDRFLTVDYSSPGQILIFDHRGHEYWRFKPGGDNALDKPSLAEPLPNGDILCTDDDNNRVIIVDPTTNQIVWQYGVKGKAGRAPGLLSDPDGADLAPPNSLAIRHAKTMGVLPPG